jgi:hypothetical protein
MTTESSNEDRQQDGDANPEGGDVVSVFIAFCALGLAYLSVVQKISI